MTPSADLTGELRAARPVAGDDLRQRVRAIAETKPRRRPSPFARTTPRRIALVALPITAAVAIGVAGIAGVVGSDTSQRLTESPPLAVESAGGDRDAMRAAAPSMKDGGTTTGALAPADGRAQRYSAQLTIAVKDNDALSEATQSALATAQRLGGYVVAVQYATAETGTASMTLRVPTAGVQDAIVSLSRLGRIVAQQVQIDDLQGRIDELTKRETALREQIGRLSARLAAPALDNETRAVLEARRDAARSELGQVRAERTQVGGEARLATIHLALETEQGIVVPATPSRIDRALDEAGRILAWEAASALYVLVIAAPLLVIALAAWLAQRAVRRRQEARLLSAS